jgi:hypothetical protein
MLGALQRHPLHASVRGLLIVQRVTLPSVLLEEAPA